MHPWHGRIAPDSNQHKAEISELEAKLLSLYETLDLVFRAIKFIYDILSSLHRRRKKKAKLKK